MSINLALSLALSGRYDDAVAVLGPLALGPDGTPGERQNLALIHALRGDSRNAERVARLDLDPQAATRQLAFYDTLRLLSPACVLAKSTTPGPRSMAA